MDLSSARRAMAEWLRACGPGPQEGFVAAPALAPPAGFQRASARLPQARLGPGRWGLDAIWRREGLDPGLLDCPAPVATRWFSLRFDPQGEPDARWRSFGRVRVWTPRLEWRAGVGLFLRLEDGADPRERRRCRQLLDLLDPAEDPARIPTWTALEPPAESAGACRAWQRQVEQVLATLTRPGAELDKVVLARRRGLQVARADLAPDWLARLARAQPESWPYQLSWGGPVWLGASPERLFTRRGRQLEAQALAGTRPRGADMARDRRLGRELLHSDKERREHAVVRDWLRERLTELTGVPPAARGPRLRRLASLQHLESRLSLRLPADVTDGALLAALHPTPALCGRPRGAALALLRELEPHDRGLYGGVLGFRDNGGCEARVAIRGALLQGRRIWLWSGAGLVAGSDPGDEWRETTDKQQALLQAWGRPA
ncbi:MAG: isochorismate synthase [Candidatus Delongbacteria bacterium]